MYENNIAFSVVIFMNSMKNNSFYGTIEIFYVKKSIREYLMSITNNRKCMKSSRKTLPVVEAISIFKYIKLTICTIR